MKNRQAINYLSEMDRREACGFYHVCTNGTVLPWMFRDEADFVAGINRIAICKVIAGVEVWTFTLMDNHVHFLLYSTMSLCKHFIDKYKFLTGIWISQKYGLSKHIKDLPVSIIPLKTEEDILETIAYIDRNAIVAGFKGLPQDYPWASTCLLFRHGKKELSDKIFLKDYTVRQLRDIIRTRVNLPGDWLIDKRGMLDPTCFTEWQKVESLYKSPLRYLFYLTKKLEGKINLTLSQNQKSFISDRDLREVTKNLCFESFGQSDVRTLDLKKRLHIAKILKRDYASTPKQISRMLHLDSDILKDFI